MARTRLNPRLAKSHRTYTVEEIARLYGIQRNTVRVWIKRDGLKTVDRTRPVLVHGRVLADFIQSRRAAAKRPCPPGTLYCLRCKDARAPAGGMADFVARPNGAGDLRALCQDCGSGMYRRTRRSQIGLVLPGADIRVVEASPHMTDCPHPFFKRT